MKYLCIWLIRFYRKVLSPLKRSPCCRFTPSCSAYALEAFQKRGFFVGLILTVWRILRCNPYCAGGYDPVPEKGLRYRGPRDIPIPDECCEDGSGCHGQEGTDISRPNREAGENPPEASVHGKEKNL
ncbi:MAG: membrane protein insertion efficiency factor YidD [Clostridia bacterium]|nr:membrane protein insertion efficiency factor YidD [Clostridia bacterium]